MASLLHSTVLLALLSLAMTSAEHGDVHQDPEVNMNACIHQRSSLVGDIHQDPEVNMNAIQLIRSKGFPAETHYVQTPDGYILGLHRIPHGKNMSANVSRPVIFLQHGLLCSSTNWLTNLENESFAYILAQKGFDVWMGNIRGNTYSRKHTTLSSKDRKFWDFSFDEHSHIDLPAMLDRALQVSQQDQLYYVGHSQGTMMGFAGFTTNKTLAAKVKKFFALAPVATVKHIRGLFHYMSELYKEIEFLLDIFGHGEFLPNTELIKSLGKHVCTADMEIEDLCGDIIFLICGFDRNKLNISRLPVYYTHTPAGTSVKNVAHFAQEVKSGKFEMYDYGSDNPSHYNGSSSPPTYDVSQLTVQTALFYAGNDWLADPQDVHHLINTLPPDVVFFKKNITYYDHLDFIWAMDAAPEVYDVIISCILNETCED